MTDIYNRKYITEDGNEYIVVSSSYVGRDRMKYAGKNKYVGN